MAALVRCYRHRYAGNEDEAGVWSRGGSGRRGRFAKGVLWRWVVAVLSVDSVANGAGWADEGLGDMNCLVEVTDNGSADQLSWYDLWGEVQAIRQICVKRGFVGRSVGLGECCASGSWGC